MGRKLSDFCACCRKETEYTFQKQTINESINGKEYEFLITSAICTDCGNEMPLNELFDLNVGEVDEQYRSKEGIVSQKAVHDFLNMCDYGQKTLFLPLDIDGSALDSYRIGVVPTKAHSGLIEKALAVSALKAQKKQLP